MLRNYCVEVGKMDNDIATILRRNIAAKPRQQPKKLENVREGMIKKNPWGIVYKVHEDRMLKNKLLFLDEKHLFSSDT